MFSGKYKYFLVSFVFTMTALDLFIIKDLKFVFFELFYVLGGIYTCLEINKRKVFYRSNTVHKNRSTFLWGNYYSDINDQDVVKEQDLYQKMKFGSQAKRIVLSLIAGIVCSSISLSFFGVEYLPFTIFIPLIISSTYIGHLFFIGLIKIIAIIGILGINNKSALLYYVLSIILIHYIFSFKNNKKKNTLLETIKSITPFLILFCAFQYVLPKNRKESIQEIKKITESKKETKVIKLKGISKAQAQMLKSKGSNFSNQIDNMIQSIDKLDNQIQNLPEFEMSDIDSDMQNIKFELEQSKNELDDILSKKDITQDDLVKINELLKKLESLKERSKKLKTKVKTRAKSLDKKPSTQTNNESFKEIDETTKESKLDTKEFKDLVKKLGKPKLKPENAEKKLNEDTSRALHKKKDKKKSNQWIRVFELISKSLLAFVFIWFVRSLYQRFKKSEDNIFSRPERLSIKKEINRIRKLKLSPNEEVIASYNVFKDIVKLREYEFQEVPPPRVLAMLSEHNEYLGGVTTLFCSCFYGEYQVEAKDLKSFRRDIHKIIT